MMQFSRQRKISYISSFPPRRCGIATFASDLIKNTCRASARVFQPIVVVMKSGSSQHFYEFVECVIRRDVKSEYMEATDFINSWDVEAVSLQHESGLFDGSAVSYIVPLLRKLKVPVISTLRTILDKSLTEYYQALIDIRDCSDTIIVMNRIGH